MKKILFSMVVFGCLFTGSCDKKSAELRLPEATLAGSVDHNGFYHPITEATGRYNGNPFSGFRENRSMMSITKLRGSETEVSLKCYLDWEQGGFWEDGEIFIMVPRIPLTGESYDVQFDHTSTDATIDYNGADGPVAVSASVAGWVKVKGYSFEGDILPVYECRITIDCAWGDGETLSVEITGIDSFHYMV